MGEGEEGEEGVQTPNPTPKAQTPNQVAESTTVQNTLNTLTVTFRANMRLEPGSIVSISGLVGSTTEGPRPNPNPNGSLITYP